MTDRLRTRWSHWLRSMFANSPTRPITLVRPELLEDRAVPAVTGWVFQDFNANGTRDLSNTPPNAGNVTYGAAIDRGLGGVTVTAFDATGAVRGTAVSAANGSYTLNVSGSQTDPLRIEFTTLPAGFFAGPHGPDSGTTVQFVPDANATASVGLVRPTDFASDDPIIINTLFNYGPHNEGPNGTALYAVRYSAGGNGSTASNYTAGTRLIDVPKDRLGAVYGVAYDPYRRDVYASAYFKRHVGFGPDGTGAVYRFNYPVGAAAGFAPPPGSLLYADLNAIFGVNTAGPNQHDLTDENGNGLADDYDTDNGNAGWDAVGKTGLGGMDSSDDGQFVFVMNLFDRQLYRIPTSGPLNTTTIQRVSIPLTNPDTTGTIISPARFRSDDLRPFAVQFHQGRVYVGVTYTAETLATGPGDQTARDELMAAVYELNPATMTFTGPPVFTARLNYLRSQSSTGFSSTDRPPSPWEPWRPTYFSINTTPSFGVAPQAIFSDIAFDPAGNMTLGLRDRGSDQIGYFSLSNPNSSTQRVEGFTTGDMLQAFINTPNNLASGWTLENNARGPAGQGTGPQNNDRGPGGAEFYFEENFNTGHGETSMGALLQVPGFPDVVSTQMDPGVDIRSGGFKWMNTSTGAVAKGYQAYATTNGNAPLDTFGKANGLGGLTLVREFAPVEIGNRLFRDLNSNGVQDAGEPGLGGVTVELFDPATNTVIGSVTTAADGSYYFSNDTRRANVPGGNALFSATILPNTPYRVRIDRTQATLAGYGLSPRDNDPSTDGDNRDSDAFAAGTLAVIDATTGDSGQNAHTFDAGFTRGRIGDTVFLDANGNSLSDAGEGLPGVVLRLTADILGNGTTQTFTATTGANGFYEFTDLPFSTPANNPITYRVTVDPTTVVANVTQTVDPDGTLDNTSTTVLTEAAPNDPTRDFGYRGTASLGNRVWYDADGDGAQDASEPGIGGATVTATWFGANGVLGGGDDYNFTTTTAADGTYLFTGLPANALVGSTPNYRVQVTPPARFPTHTDSLDNGGVPAPLNPVDVQVSPVGGDPLNARRDVDFGYRGTARLGDRVWLDTNANGVQDGTEAGVNGVTVELFFDANNDGVFDAGELAAPLLAATTAGGGLYAFTDLAAGNYRVRFGNTASGVTYTRTSADSTLATDATDSDANTATGFTGNYTLALGDNNPTVDAGLYLPVSIGDTVWYDTNGNGTQEATESGIPGVVLVLDYAGPDGVFNSTGDVIGLLTVTTGANGTYTFPDLAPGTYRVRVQDATVPLSPFTYTTPSGNTQTSTPTSGNNDLARDFGIRGTGTIGDTVFLDPNANGQPDAGEGLAGVVVRLTGDLDGDGVVEANETLTATTNAAGFYQFTNLRTTPGGVPYTVTVDATTLPQGAGAPVANTVDPNGANDNTSISTISTAAPNDPTQDFGYRGPGAIGDTVFLDVNANGTPDAGEGLTGVTVRLTADVDGNGTTETFTATTDATGNYRFEGLPLADRLGNPIQYRVTVGAGLPTDATNTTDPDGVTDATSVVTLTTANPVNLAQDFGYRGPGSIGDRVFLDLNANGVWEAGEGLNGVTVVLTADVTGDGLPDLTVTATTGPDGFYLFENLPATTSGGPVQYTVRVVTTTLPTGVGNTADPDGVLDSTWTGDLFETVDNPNRRNADFGYRSSASLGDRVWLDRDGDGVQGVVADEPGLAGVRVTLTYAGTDGVLGTADDVTTATTTDAAGNYSFGNLPVGSFQVVVDPTTLPANVAQTFDFDGLGTPHTAIATLTTGQNRTDIDFGYRGAAALGDRVWLDQNRNGGQDPGEAGIPGAVVQLELAGRDGVLGTTDDLRFTATTAANGVYNFAGLPIYAPGGDAFRVTVVSLPAGGVAAVGDLDSAPGTGDQSATGTLGANQTRTDVDFGYAGSGVIRGSVYVDLNNDGVRQPGEVGIPGTVLVLTGTDPFGNPIVDPLTGGPLTATADADGQYRFINLPPGTYTVTELQPGGFLDGTDTAGTLGGTAGNDVIGSILLPAGGDSSANNFGELQPAAVGGDVYQDRNNNGVRDPAEPGIPGVVMVLTGTDDRGPVALTLTTDGNGSYQFTNLRPGTYTLTQTQPPLYSQGTNSAGSAGGTVAPADVIRSFTLGSGVLASGYQFGEILRQLDPITPPPQVPVTVPPAVVSKKQFLGSTPTVATVTAASSPDFAALGSVNTTRPVQFVATADGPGGGQVRVFDLTNGAERFRFTPFPGESGGVRTAIGDLTGDGIPDVVVAAGPGGLPRVTIYDGNSGQVVRTFLAYEEAFRGGSLVAVGDLDGDGRGDLVVGADAGGGPRVRVFRGGDPAAVMADFWGIEDMNFRGGARVAVGDVNADGRVDLVVGAGSGGGPRVAIYDGRTVAAGTPLKFTGDFFAFEPNFSGGVYVSVADVDGDGYADVITGAGEGGGPRVQTFSGRELTAGRPTVVSNLFAFDPNGNSGGVRVAATDLNGDGRAELFVGTGPGIAPLARFVDPFTGRAVNTFTPDWTNTAAGVFVG